jgi:hypothetical protein
VKQDGRERTAGLVNVGEDLGGVALLSKGSQGAGSTVDAGDTNGDNRNADDEVHEVVESDETSIFTSQDEGRDTISVRVGGVEQAGVLGADEHADERETKDVEEGDTPEDLLDSAGKSCSRVLGLGGSKTDELSASEGEGGSDEDGAEAGETVLEGTRSVPVASTPVLVEPATARTATANQDDSDEHEDKSSGELEARTPELLLGVTESSEDVDNNDDDEEECDPDGRVDSLIPVCDGEGADDEFERQDDQPLENLEWISKLRWRLVWRKRDLRSSNPWRNPKKDR